MKKLHRRLFLLSAVFSLGMASLTACGNSAETTDAVDSASALTVGAIPDQDPEQLQRLYGLLSDYLSTELGVPVNYVPVTD